jgi:hypothetical protein
MNRSSPFSSAVCGRLRELPLTSRCRAVIYALKLELELLVHIWLEYAQIRLNLLVHLLVSIALGDQTADGPENQSRTN